MRRRKKGLDTIEEFLLILTVILGLTSLVNVNSGVFVGSVSFSNLLLVVTIMLIIIFTIYRFVVK